MVAQQILTIQQAKASQIKEFNFEGNCAFKKYGFPQNMQYVHDSSNSLDFKALNFISFSSSCMKIGWGRKKSNYSMKKTTELI